MIKIIPLFYAAAVFFCAAVVRPACAEAGSAPASEPSSVVTIETPGPTLKQTLGAALNLPAGQASAPQQPRALIAARWDIPGKVSYILYDKALDTPAVKNRKPQAGSRFLQTLIDSSGAPAMFPQTAMVVHLNPGDLVYGRDVFAVKPPYKDIDEITRGLRENLRADLALGERGAACPCGPAQFSLAPSLQLSNFKGQFPGYRGSLDLAARHENPAAACRKNGCREYTGLDVDIDQASGLYLVTDYHDGLLYAQYAAGAVPGAENGKDKEPAYAAPLKKAFSLAPSLFDAAAQAGGSNHKALLESGLQEPLIASSAAAEQKREESEFSGLDRKMTLERTSALRKAVALSPRSPMAHAGLGLFLSRECARAVPLDKGACEKGIRELLKAEELAPALAFPAYVLLNRADSPYFPASLRRLLPKDAAAVCAGFKMSAPDWDWAFYGVCARAATADNKSLAEDFLMRAQAVPVIRPKDLLLRYLALELSALPPAAGK